jgi:predicted  nucleic acid-binding Zn ribbon protein
MYIQKITLKLDKLDKKFALEKLYSYLGVLRQSGQIIGKEFPVLKNKNSLVAIVMTLEKDSLKDLNSSKYSLSRKNDLKETLKIKIIGDCIEHENQMCDCSESSSYILYTNYLKLSSPLMCGDCFGEIPLYQLKDKEGYSKILAWESDYKACDILQMNCIVGEKFGLNQMYDLNSSLTQLGQEQTEKIEYLSKKPVYYFLYNYQTISKKKDKKRKCPNCNKKWLLKEKLHNLFDFKCDDCKLLSNLSLSS